MSERTTPSGRSSRQERSGMSKTTPIDTKVAKPATYFEEPRDVVADPKLSKEQKVEALDTLEQDARQIAEATSEGMAGGERNKLRDVLEAKDTLALQPLNEAYELVLDDLRARDKCATEVATHVMLRQGIVALEGLVAAYATTRRIATAAAADLPRT
jgi:hypothetical protein